MFLLVAGIGGVAGVFLEPHLAHVFRDSDRDVQESPARVFEPDVAAVTPEDSAARLERAHIREQGLFLDNVLLALNTYGKPGALNGEYLKDYSTLYDRLAVLLQDESPRVAEPASDVINVLALMEHTSNIEPVSAVPAVRQALEAVIAHGTHDSVRGRAIDAWTRLYPPDQAMVDTLERLLQGDMSRFPESQAAAFRAYGIFRRNYDFPLPASTVDAAKQLLRHPSQATRVKAEYALAELGGTAELPALIARLEEVGNGSEGQMLTALILRLDDSQATRDTLNRIAERTQ